MELTRCLIIGGGPAGYTAAIYAARAGLSPVLFEGPQAGGQLTTTSLIDNFPGFPDGVDPFTLTGGMREQAVRFGADIRRGVVTDVDFSGTPLISVTSEGERIGASTVIIATGASARWLGLESEKRFIGMGVSACATCDGFFYKGKDVAVVGGGDTACEEASYLSGMCRKVYMIVRKDTLRAGSAMQGKVLSRDNIEILFGTRTLEVLGDGVSGVTGARLEKSDGTVFDIAVNGFFVAIGHEPASFVFRKWIRTDENGYIITAPGSTATDVEGVFAAGDVCDPRYRQAITAAASGCMAAIDAEKYLLNR